MRVGSKSRIRSYTHCTATTIKATGSVAEEKTAGSY